MKYVINHRDEGENELVLNYTRADAEVEEVLAFMEKKQKRLIGKVDGEKVVFSPEEILYIEKVDDRTYAYTKEQVLQLDISLATAEAILDRAHFFRCSKSMILHVNKVERLKSLPSNRIDATMLNGEHILISRTYASDFRKLLRGE